MGRWLEKIEKGGGDSPSKPSKSPLGGLEGVVDGPYLEKNADIGPQTSTSWLAWIAERYVEEWRAAANKVSIRHIICTLVRHNTSPLNSSYQQICRN